MMRQLAQLAQVVIQPARKARIRAEMKRLFRYHPVCGFITSRRRANRPGPTNVIVIITIIQHRLKCDNNNNNYWLLPMYKSLGINYEGIKTSLPKVIWEEGRVAVL